MNKKVICFRFDVDTYLCASKGVPNLIKLADKLCVKFTFFFNMGRGIHHKSYLNRKTSRNLLTYAKKISNIKKLGLSGYFKIIFLNPYVGKSYPYVIKQAKERGHEIGLHGGKNHGEWLANGNLWTENRIKDEIEWGLNELNLLGINSISSFSSPGWQGSKSLHNILINKRFTVVADKHGHSLEKITNINILGGYLYSVPTNLLGEPGGVGYIENMRAKQMTDKEIIHHFQNDLSKINKLAVIYEHPYFSGIKELPIIESMINVAYEQGFNITTFNKLGSFMELTCPVSEKIKFKIYSAKKDYAT